MQNIKKGKYQHYKGQYYEVLGLVRHSEDDTALVLYKTLYEQHDGRDDLWVRPYDMFVEKITIDNKEVERFKFVGQ